MGQIFKLTDAGRHVSTGKWPYPAGEVHEPIWGPAYRDMGIMFADCQFPDCDQTTVVEP